MKASEVINNLVTLLSKYGDLEVEVMGMHTEQINTVCRHISDGRVVKFTLTGAGDGTAGSLTESYDIK